MTIATNRLIKWVEDPADPSKDVVDRVIYVFDSGRKALTVDVGQERSDPKEVETQTILEAVERGEAVLMEDDPYKPRQLTDLDYGDRKFRTSLRKCNQHWEVIEPLVTGENALKIFDCHGRADLIKKRSKVKFKHRKDGEEHTYTTKSIYGYIHKYWRGGQVKHALLGAYYNCGAPGQPRTFEEGGKPGRRSNVTIATGKQTGVSLTKRWLAIIYLGITFFLKNKKVKNPMAAYKTTLARFCPKGKKRDRNGNWEAIIPDYAKGEVFSPRQFQFRLLKAKNKNLRAFLLSRKGRRRFNLENRELIGDSTSQAPYPGALYQIDATLVNVNLANRRKPGKTLGRPVIVVIIDVFSRMIVGFCIRLEREGWLVISLALYNTIEDKVKLCDKYGITITEEMWPKAGLGDYITGDRGPMMGYNATNLVNNLQVGLSNTPPYRADWKGIIEQFFNRMDIRVIQDLPSSIKGPRERGERDSRLDAVLTLEDLTEIVLEAIIYHNTEHYMDWYELDKDMIKAEVKPYPVELYRWGVKRKSGKPRFRDEESVRINLLPEGEASLRETGIYFKGELYTCDQFRSEGWDFYARNQGRTKVRVAYDPRVPEIIYLRFSDGSPSIPCFLKNRRSPAHGADWAEMEDVRFEQKIDATMAVVPELQAQVGMDARVDKVVKIAERREKAARSCVPEMSQRERKSGVRDDRREEIARIREEEAREILEKENVLDVYRPPAADDPQTSPVGGYVPASGFDDVLALQDQVLGGNDE